MGRMEKPLNIDATQLKPAQLTAPPSKSDAHRAVVLSWLLGLPPPQCERWPTDVERLLEGLPQLGTGSVIDCGDGAAPFRFLIALAATQTGRSIFTGSDRLEERPHAPLFHALGISGTQFPLEIIGRPPNQNTLSIDGSLSSQYSSALLLVGARQVLNTGKAFTLELTGPTASRGYLEITLRWLRWAGFSVEERPAQIQLTQHTRVGQLPPVPPDWSSLGYLLLMARASGGQVSTNSNAEHPDRIIVEHLKAYDATGTLDADISKSPDLAPTLAALILGGKQTGVLRNVSILKHKESDRLDAIQSLAHAVGGTTQLEGDTVSIAPPSQRPEAFQYDARADHRLIMSSVALACALRCRLEVSNAVGVEKSFPDFWLQAERIGVRKTG